MFKKISFTVVLLSVIWVATGGDLWAKPAEVNPAARIMDITVYPDRALIRKEAVCALQQGDNLVLITGITPHLLDESVQVSIRGKSPIRILDVKVERTHLQKVQPEKMKNLQERLDGLNGRIKAHSDEIAAINGASDFLKKVIPFSQNQKASPAEVERYARFLEKSLAENLGRAAKIEDRLKKLQEEKKAVESELAGLSAEADAGKTIAVFLQSPEKSREATLVVSYIAAGAGWSPQYEARADSSTTRVEVNGFAVIRQSTGEDWKDARIEISTARPSVRGIPPELSAWVVDVFRPRPIRLKAAAPQEADRMMAREAMANAAPLPAFEEAKIETQATSVSFILPRRADIPSDGQPHRILIASSGKEATFEYYAVPKLSPYAYLRAGLQNPFSFPLLPGSMNIYLDGRFMSTWFLAKTIVPEEKMDLSLGVDEGIRIERKLQNRLTEYRGVFSGDARINYEYALDITNGKDKAVSLILMDQFPLSRNEQIRVEQELPKGDQAKIAEDGIISWSLKLEPREKKSLKVKFRVEHPKALRIIGLE
jgi:uncharacterized protein (TIGR02231 family)